MARKHKRIPGSRKYNDFTPETLQQTLKSVINGEISCRQAAKLSNISVSTLHRKLKGEFPKTIGGQCALSPEQEHLFSEYVLKVFEFGFSIEMFDLRCLLKSFLDQKGQTVKCFKNNFPGPDWTASFLQRHEDLRLLFENNIIKQRSAVSFAVMDTYFDNLETELNGIPPSHTWNYDETNLTDDPGSKKVIRKRGCKYPERKKNASKSPHSIMFCGNALGEVLPPYVVYKSEHMWTKWTQGGPKDVLYNFTKSGWFDIHCFEDWFTTLVLPRLMKQQGTKALIGDNLSSHLSSAVVENCVKYDIRFICLPANSMHLAQPLNLAYFKPMKSAWCKIITDFKSNCNVSPIPKGDFPKLLNQLVTALSVEEVKSLVNGFQKAGICPLDRTQIISRLPISAAFLQCLEQQKCELSPGKPKRKRKLEVTTGKNILPEDQVENSELERLNSYKSHNSLSVEDLAVDPSGLDEKVKKRKRHKAPPERKGAVTPLVKGKKKTASPYIVYCSPP